jgi:thioredoxin-like negative regulator of GroEL
MKQAYPCLCVLLSVLLAGCEIGTEPAAAPRAAAPQASQTDGSLPNQRSPAEGTVQPVAPQVAGGQLQFIDGYAQGLQRAQADHKPMLVFFTAEWCHFCHQMADEAFTSPQVITLAQQFVCVLVDADAEAAVCRQFRVQAFPTVQFVSARGIPLNRVVGKKPGHQLMIAMQAALQSVARRPTNLEIERPL